MLLILTEFALPKPQPPPGLYASASVNFRYRIRPITFD
jgi:hypothetical protein